jgi:leucyl-tRNA synthetase
MGPLEASLPWSNQGLEGARRFLDRVYRFYTETEYRQTWTLDEKAQSNLSFAYHTLVKKVTKDFESLQLNTAISQFMIFMNEAYKAEQIYQPYMESFLVMLSCLAPHMSEELWAILGHKTSITQATWPIWDEQQLIQSTVEMAISINGKLRATLSFSIDSPDALIIESALSLPVIQKQLEGKKIIKTIVVKNKILNIVVG